ncbi:pre-mRNA cleavage complex 2 protein Pcf11-like [Dryobates pubescens]|uniref:pre-mRNA cleavage complex 2 protein Pcf11-like n=1 Tax=Dryobates pubescens TaxID=118200 RepID=UPI0023B8B189|nr:pre-mRNA cleavage complex 2 protein Pcf11-like [Dryobates pubescens]
MPESESSRGRRGVSGDVCQGYQAWLQGLILNSKSAITRLTVLAQQNVAFASSIASLVEAQMAKAPPSQKLPVIYLMDSIVKNVGGEYLKAFAPNLVETFLSVFEKVDIETRKSLFLLRSTWDRIFPLEKLHALDVRVKSLDPAWPVKPLPPDGNAAGTPVSPQPAVASPEECTAPACARAAAPAPPALAETPKPLTQEQLLRQQVLEKEKELLEVRQKISELEQAQAQLCPEAQSNPCLKPVLAFSSQQGEEHQALAECPHQRHQEICPAAGRILSPRAPKQQHCLGLRFEGPPGQPLGPHGQPGGGIRFEEPHGQPLGPQGLSGQFNTEVPLRFDGHCQPASGFDLPLGLQGVPFQNMAPHAPSRLGMSPCGQGGPFVQHPEQGSHRPSHRMQLQSTAGPGAQDCPRRAGAQHWDATAPQGPQHGSFRNISMGSRQVPVTFAQPGPCGQAQQHWPHPGSLVQNPAGALPLSRPDNHLGQLHVNELFARLLSAGILHLPNPAPTSAQGNEPSAQPAAEGKAAEQKEDVPDLTDFQVEELRQRYSSAINALHTGIQCGSCGVRLATSQGYAEHLDWHYGRNRSRKAAGRAAAHRQWYCSSAEWIEFAAAADLQKTAKSQIFERAHEAVLKARQASKKDEIQSVPAGPAGAAESCEICQEQFEQYWDDEEEEWRLRNAIRVDAKIYHPSCYKD